MPDDTTGWERVLRIMGARAVSVSAIETRAPLWSGSAASPVSGNQIVSGSPTATLSFGAISALARNTASHRPAGCGCTT